MLVSLVAATLVAGAAAAQEPFTLDQVLELLEAKADQEEIIEQIESHKADFELSRENLTALVRAGASDALLEAIEAHPYQPLVITSPAEGAEVGAYARVTGRSQPIPGKHLWLFAHRKDLAVWWPQSGEILLEEDGTWQQSAFLGQPQDVGFDFELVVRWVSDDVHRRMVDYLSRGEATGHFPGIRLPDGEPSATVTVRKTSHR
ncbi:MAG: hypothetical protein D6696_16105 [Acidobacteria bacterium]|nr:MAG: hypothetical protein D6696_16105 [Acidobacteriota bacterium]